ncbi:MAG TPA: sulfotransferase, partial [Segeticoccus sp.]|uniref:sulfotransferase family protein n=1 Tax=Segeticoccus sp. TaxID=2706531 RepID=UPI002D801571
LLEAFPQARFVNVIRDGRAVANSWLQMGWWDGYEGPDNWYLGPLPPRERELWEASGRDFVVLAALGWHLLMQSFEEARAGVSADQWLDLRYEDLVAAPRESAGRLLEFVGLDWSADYEAGFARHTFQASRGAAWRRDLGAEQVRKVEQAVGPTLARYGYQLTEGRPDPAPSMSDGLPPLVPVGELATHS